MILCKDCCWYEKAHILLSDGTTRDYTDDDVDDLGIKNCVSCDVGINVGGRCKYYSYNDTCWMEEDDFCSKGQMTALEHNNKWNEQLKEQINEWM